MSIEIEVNRYPNRSRRDVGSTHGVAESTMAELSTDQDLPIVFVTMLVCGTVLVLGGHAIGGPLIWVALGVRLNRD